MRKKKPTIHCDLTLPTVVRSHVPDPNRGGNDHRKTAGNLPWKCTCGRRHRR